jgi:hypothetical protein
MGWMVILDTEPGYTSSKEDEVVDIFADDIEGFKQRMNGEDGEG